MPINCEDRSVTGELCGVDISHPLAERWCCKSCYTTHCPSCEDQSRHRCAECQGQLCDNCEDTVYRISDGEPYHAKCLALVPLGEQKETHNPAIVGVRGQFAAVAA